MNKKHLGARQKKAAEAEKEEKWSDPAYYSLRSSLLVGATALVLVLFLGVLEIVTSWTVWFCYLFSILCLHQILAFWMS
jgi:hypothetical protein